MAALQGSGAVAAVRGQYPRSSREIEDLQLFYVRQGAYRDVTDPAVPYTRLGQLTTGPRVGGSMQIRGGTL